MARRVLGIVVILYLAGLVALSIGANELLGEIADPVAAALAGTAWGSPVLIEAVAWGTLFLIFGVLVGAYLRAGALWLAFAACLAVAAAIMFGQLLFRPEGSSYGFNLLGAVAGSAVGVLIVAIVSAATRPRGARRTSIG